MRGVHRRRVAIVGALLLAALAFPAVASAATPTVIAEAPEDGKEITTRTETFEVQVNDSGFDNGETVDFSIVIGNVVEYQEDITSNQTITYTHDFNTGFESGGEIEWYAFADDGSNTTASPDRTIFVPADLRIENESDPGTLITNTTEVTFYGNGQVYTRSTSDGTLSLAGLPARDYVINSVVVDGSYISRSNYILDPYSDKTIYHLPANATTIESRFTIRDQTGIFSSSSVVQIQRAINSSGSVEYETVSADRFGSEGFTAVLESNQRYRVRIISEDLENFQVVGPYRSDVSEAVTVEPGDPVVNVGEFEQGWNASIEQDIAGASLTTYTVTYADPEIRTDEITIWLSYTIDGSQQKTGNRTYYDVETISDNFITLNDTSETTVFANFVVERGNESYRFTRAVYRQDTSGVPVNIDNGVIQIVSGLVLLLTAGLFSQTNHEIGAVVVVALAGVLWAVSLDGGMATAAVLVSAGLIAILFKLAKTR